MSETMPDAKPDTHVVHKREFDNACLKLTAIMRLATNHSHDDDSPHRLFCLDLLDILTGKAVVTAAEHHEALAKAKVEAKALDEEPAEPIAVTEAEVAEANKVS